MNDTWKRCSTCGVNRPLGEFVGNPRCAGGYEPRCKACPNSYENAWRAAGGAERRKLREKERRDAEWARIRAAVLGEP
jgi:hypothetical protein